MSHRNVILTIIGKWYLFLSVFFLFYSLILEFVAGYSLVTFYTLLIFVLLYCLSILLFVLNLFFWSRQGHKFSLKVVTAKLLQLILLLYFGLYLSSHIDDVSKVVIYKIHDLSSPKLSIKVIDELGFCGRILIEKEVAREGKIYTNEMSYLEMKNKINYYLKCQREFPEINFDQYILALWQSSWANCEKTYKRAYIDRNNHQILLTNNREIYSWYCTLMGGFNYDLVLIPKLDGYDYQFRTNKIIFFSHNEIQSVFWRHWLPR